MFHVTVNGVTVCESELVSWLELESSAPIGVCGAGNADKAQEIANTLHDEFSAADVTADIVVVEGECPVSAREKAYDDDSCEFCGLRSELCDCNGPYGLN